MIVFSRFQTVLILGHSLPISFNMKAIKDFEDETNVKLFDLLNLIGKGGFDNRIIPLLWFALVEGYRLKEGVKPPFERSAVEAMDLDVLMDLIGALTKSIEKMGDSEKKKLAAEANKRQANPKN